GQTCARPMYPGPGRVLGDGDRAGRGGAGQGQAAGELGEVGFPVRVGRFAASAGAGADRAREVLAALVSAQDAWRRGRPPPRPPLIESSRCHSTPPNSISGGRGGGRPLDRKSTR